MINFKQRKNNNLTVVDLFCGAGIGAYGIKKAGFNIIYALDNQQYAIDTYNKNISNHAICANIKKIDLNTIPYADVFIGGFPCQSFSSGGSGKGINDKDKGDLGFYFFKAVKLKQPKVFVLENVKGITSKKHKYFLDELFNKFKSIGYNIEFKVSNCYEYGVPQIRERLFVVGVRKDIKNKFIFPDILPENKRNHLIDAIGDLPDPDSEHNIPNHKKYYNGGYSSRYLSRNRQRQWNQPSYTICSSARQLPLHPEPANYDIRKMDEYDYDPPRRFTVRECLRLQTVPDDFIFDESIDYLKQHIRCSGIPSLVAYKIFINIENLLI